MRALVVGRVVEVHVDDVALLLALRDGALVALAVVGLAADEPGLAVRAEVDLARARALDLPRVALAAGGEAAGADVVVGLLHAPPLLGEEVELDRGALLALEVAAVLVLVVEGGAVEGLGAVVVDEELALAAALAEGVVVEVALELRGLDLVAGAAADLEAAEARALAVVRGADPVEVLEVEDDDLVRVALDGEPAVDVLLGAVEGLAAVVVHENLLVALAVVGAKVAADVVGGALKVEGPGALEGDDELLLLHALPALLGDVGHEDLVARALLVAALVEVGVGNVAVAVESLGAVVGDEQLTVAAVTGAEIVLGVLAVGLWATHAEDGAAGAGVHLLRAGPGQPVPIDHDNVALERVCEQNVTMPTAATGCHIYISRIL